MIKITKPIKEQLLWIQKKFYKEHRISINILNLMNYNKKDDDSKKLIMKETYISKQIVWNSKYDYYNNRNLIEKIIKTYWFYNEKRVIKINKGKVLSKN